MNHKSKGILGERLAKQYFEGIGFEVLEQNYRHGRSEIDLIVHKDNCLVFVEVKLRSRTDFGLPESFVSAAQEDRIRQAAENYIFAINWTKEVRFDIVCVYGAEEVEVFEDAF